jgi:hypothetical protein
VKIFCCLFLTAVFSFSTLSAQGASSTLYSQFSGKNVRIHLAEIKDSTTDHKVSISEVSARLTEALVNRKSIRFQVVGTPGEADLVVQVDLKGFFWSNHDPVDMIAGLGATAMDVAIVEDYAKLEADFIVTDAKTGETLWQDRVIATVTKKPMSESESLPLITQDLAKVFIKQCFGKKRR